MIEHDDFSLTETQAGSVPFLSILENPTLLHQQAMPQFDCLKTFITLHHEALQHILQDDPDQK